MSNSILWFQATVERNSRLLSDLLDWTQHQKKTMQIQKQQLRDLQKQASTVKPFRESVNYRCTCIFIAHVLVVQIFVCYFDALATSNSPTRIEMCKWRDIKYCINNNAVLINETIVL